MLFSVTDAWFYVPDIAAEGGQMTLDGREAHHAAAARRLTEGDMLTLFDGRGAVARGAVTAVRRQRREIGVRIESRETHPLPRPAVHVACALPKGDRQGVLFNMAGQLGVSSITPLLTERAIVTPGRGFADRTERVLIEACKQSRRPHVPMVNDAMALDAILERAAHDGSIVLIAHPGGRPLLRELQSHSDGKRPIMLIVGPEGGLTDEEVDAAMAGGGVIVDLGDGVLRIETAAVAMLAAVRMHHAGS